jgi:hypothetical protein
MVLQRAFGLAETQEIQLHELPKFNHRELAAARPRTAAYAVSNHQSVDSYPRQAERLALALEMPGRLFPTDPHSARNCLI